MFYFSGFVTFAWCITWALIITDDPVNHKFISKKELDYILEHMVIPRARESVPLGQILRNKAVTSIMIVSFANDFGLNTMLTEGPHFMNAVLKKDIATVSTLIIIIIFENMSTVGVVVTCGLPIPVSRVRFPDGAITSF